jgi:hypothetical protein
MILLIFTNSVAPELKGSSPYSQESATCTYPEPTESTLHNRASLAKIHSKSILPSSEWSLYLGLPIPKHLHFSLRSHACHMSRCTLL